MRSAEAAGRGASVAAAAAPRFEASGSTAIAK